MQHDTDGRIPLQKSHQCTGVVFIPVGQRDRFYLFGTDARP
ncbi:MAG: hypothetical protein SVV80_00545 [Planctomycetota bacterium]|nr:hypothetical protein [Planctomycetota bacterium]